MYSCSCTRKESPTGTPPLLFADRQLLPPQSAVKRSARSQAAQATSQGYCRCTLPRGQDRRCPVRPPQPCQVPVLRPSPRQCAVVPSRRRPATSWPLHLTLPPPLGGLPPVCPWLSAPPLRPADLMERRGRRRWFRRHGSCRRFGNPRVGVHCTGRACEGRRRVSRPTAHAIGTGGRPVQSKQTGGGGVHGTPCRNQTRPVRGTTRRPGVAS